MTANDRRAVLWLLLILALLIVLGLWVPDPGGIA